VSLFVRDINIPSEINKPSPEPTVLRWLGTVEEAQPFISVVSLGEMRKGCELLEPGSRRCLQSQRWLDRDIPKWLAHRILPVTDAIAHRQAPRRIIPDPLGNLYILDAGRVSASIAPGIACRSSRERLRSLAAMAAQPPTRNFIGNLVLKTSNL